MIDKNEVLDLINKRTRRAEDELMMAADADPEIYQQMQAIIGELNGLYNAVIDLEEGQEDIWDMVYDEEWMEYHPPW